MIQSGTSVRTQPDAEARSKGRFFYGWVIAVAAALGVGCGVSAFIPATTGLLVGPLGKEFGWSPPQIFAAIIFATTAGMVVAPFVGRLIDRYGPWRIIAVSYLLEALVIASYNYQGRNISWFYLRYAALSFFATGTTAVTFSALISRWFDRRRGLALGVALAGMGLGGAVWTLLTHALFSHFGWRTAYLYMGGVIVVVALPLLLLIVRDSPASMGLNIDGDTGPMQRKEVPVLTGMTLRQAAKTGQFWLIAFTFFLISCVVYGVMLNLVPFLRSQGLSLQVAVSAQASQWAVLTVGRVVTGWFMDRFFAPRVALAFLIPATFGVALLASGVSGYAIFVAVILVGLAVGAEVDVLAYLTSRYFGLKHYGLIYAIFFSIFGIATAIGPTVTAALAIKAHGYVPVLWGLVATMIVVCVSLLCYRRFPEEFAAQRAVESSISTVVR